MEKQIINKLIIRFRILSFFCLALCFLFSALSINEFGSYGNLFYASFSDLIKNSYNKPAVIFLMIGLALARGVQILDQGQVIVTNLTKGIYRKINIYSSLIFGIIFGIAWIAMLDIKNIFLSLLIIIVLTLLAYLMQKILYKLSSKDC